MVNRSIVTMVLLIGAMIVCLTQQIGCFVTASNPPILSVWRTPAESILDPVASFRVFHRNPFLDPLGESGGLESRATDFGSGVAWSRVWGSRVWESRIPRHRFRSWCRTCLSLRRVIEDPSI